MKNRAAFSLLELLIVMAIMAILASVVIPNFRGAQPRYEREQFIARLNALMQFAWQQAITTYKIHRVSFDLQKRLVTVFHEVKLPEKKREPVFKPVTGNVRASFTWPEQISIKEFIIEGFDEMKRSAGKKTEEIWFYVIPDGLTQMVIINAFDEKDTKAGKPRTISLVLNPFNAQF